MAGYTIYNMTKPITYPPVSDFLIHYFTQIDVTKPKMVGAILEQNTIQSIR